MAMSFDDFFRTATNNPEPYPYQRRFATGEALPSLLSAPTGIGKTATVVLGWLWRRRFATNEVKSKTPRRLVYCLPMRTLVEQTRNECLRWLDRHNLIAGDIRYVNDDHNGLIESYSLELGSDENGGKIGVHVLMGGEGDSAWDAYPERDAILIGTQDMLLSRALNRGYGMSRYRWPMPFGLLNNDCLWVLDETQLIGVGLTTSCQLAGLREKLGTFGDCQTLWMSATLDNEALATVDHPKPDPDMAGLTLNDEDRNHDQVKQLLTAAKPFSVAETKLDADSAKKGYEVSLGDEVHKQHRDGTLTLVVVNNVARSQELFQTLEKRLSKEDLAPELYLIHSRFRPADRQDTQAKALDESTIVADGPGRIVISTQAIEAGVDISASTLFTELAPWSSMVQRFGRCNRRGLCGVDGNEPAAVFCIDIDTSDGKKSKLTLPYEADLLDRAREQLVKLSDVGPAALNVVSVEEPQPIVHVLRRKDLLDLFDTTPDLSGNDLDVSRYIRDSDDTDVQVYWRDWDLTKSPRQPPPSGIDREVFREDFPAPHRRELCSVSVARLRDFTGKMKQQLAWCWDPLEETWTSVGKSHIRPGMSVLLHRNAGGYDEQLGWTANAKHQPQPVLPDMPEPMEAMSDDDNKGSGRPVELTRHLNDVVAAAELLKQAFGSADAQIPWSEILTAARWHDVGKVHLAFQTAMNDSESVRMEEEFRTRLWAKSGERRMPNYRVPINAGIDDAAMSVDEAAELTHDGTADFVTVGQAPPDAVAFVTTADPSASAAALNSPDKSANETSQKFQRRRGFRHELASALAWLEHHSNAEDAATVNLVAYLIAAHHGKVRLSIRSMPNEYRPNDPSVKFARGIWEGDDLPAVDLGNHESSTPLEVSLDLMSLGESAHGISWLARTLALRNAHGPFRLAFLETLLRIADWRGSAAGEES